MKNVPFRTIVQKYFKNLTWQKICEVYFEFFVKKYVRKFLFQNKRKIDQLYFRMQGNENELKIV